VHKSLTSCVSIFFVVLSIGLIGQSFVSELTEPFSSIFINTFSQFQPAHNFVSVLSNPLTLFFAIPLAGYIFLRSEIDKIEFLQIKKILCYSVVILLVSSAVITPYSFSPYAFAEIELEDEEDARDDEDDDARDDEEEIELEDEEEIELEGVIYSTHHVSSVNGTSSPTQEQDEAIPTGETTASPSNSTDSPYKNEVFDNEHKFLHPNLSFYYC